MFGAQHSFQLSLDEPPYLLSLHEDFFTNDQTAKRSGHGRILMYILSEKMSCDLLNALGHNDDRFSCFATIFQYQYRPYCSHPFHRFFIIGFPDSLTSLIFVF